jgi:hypothetical protein
MRSIVKTGVQENLGGRILFADTQPVASTLPTNLALIIFIQKAKVVQQHHTKKTMNSFNFFCLRPPRFSVEPDLEM